MIANVLVVLVGAFFLIFLGAIGYWLLLILSLFV